MDIPVTAEIQEDNIYSPSKRPNMELDIKAQIKADVMPKFEVDVKIKIEPVEEFNRDIPVKVEIKNKAIDVPLKRPKTEMDVKPKIETDFEAKSDDLNRGMTI